MFLNKEGDNEYDCDEEGDDEDNHDEVEAQMAFMFCCRKCKSTRVDFPSGITASNRMNDKRERNYIYIFLLTSWKDTTSPNDISSFTRLMNKYFLFFKKQSYIKISRLPVKEVFRRFSWTEVIAEVKYILEYME